MQGDWCDDDWAGDLVEGRKWYKIFRNHYGQPKVVELDDDEDIHVL